MSLIGLLVLIIVFGLLFYLVDLIPMPPPFKVAARVVVVLILILVLLGQVGWLGDVRIR
jgi:hypothetical protein